MGSEETAMRKETELIKWVSKQYKKGAEVASICNGAFLLAATGILDGKRATTHWLVVERFQKLFPHVTLEPGKIITDETGVYTCGGAFSFTSLMIYLIEKYCGHELAAIASKIFLVHVHTVPQSAFTIFNLQKNHADEAVLKVQNSIEINYAKNISINQLCNNANMSMRTLIRKFSLATGNTPNEYIQRVKIEAAKKILEEGAKRITEIAMEIGYEDNNYFRKIFKRYTGISPVEYRKKYGTLFSELLT